MSEPSSTDIDDDSFLAAFAEAMYYCVGCRACETACPAGVAGGGGLDGGARLTPLAP